ncbi:MAG: MaoC family dehydratase [Dehalococcoidia bacterium]|nr:MaoC family dehydratase [Dehalococcoidia bacterium]
MNENVSIDFDRTVLGRAVEGESVVVTREKILAFARAVGETNPLYTDDDAARRAGYPSLIAPPTFINFIRRNAARPDPKIKHGTLTFFANQTLECRLPVKPGDAIRSVTSLEDVYAKTGRSGTMVFEVWKTEMFNQHGQVVAVSRESTVHR